MTTSDLGLASATDLVKLYKARKASPVETTKAALARIAKHNPALNAFVLVDDGAALIRGRDLGVDLLEVLEGVPQ